MDIGASYINEIPIYKKLIDEKIAHLTAFEGDKRQINKIKDFFQSDVTVFNDFLSNGEIKNLYLYSEESGMSSLKKPNSSHLRFFNFFHTFITPKEIIPIQTKKLNDFKIIDRVDFLKMDTQGSELDILNHGMDVLKDCVAIQLEISYLPLYEDQPCFGEVDVYLRKWGFIPHSFIDIKKWSIAPLVKNGDERIPFNQLLESDIIYIKNPIYLDNFKTCQLKILATIAHYCFESYDLTMRLILELINRGELDGSSHSDYINLILN